MTIPSEGFVHLRKAHYMFGWELGRTLPDAGIFPSGFLLASTLQELTVYTLSRPMSAPARQSPVPFVPSQNPLL